MDLNCTKDNAFDDDQQDKGKLLNLSFCICSSFLKKLKLETLDFTIYISFDCRKGCKKSNFRSFILLLSNLIFSFNYSKIHRQGIKYKYK